MSKLKGLIELIEDAIENGATSIEDVQIAISNEPLDLLARIEPLESTMNGIKEIHNQTIGSIYNMIRKVNQEVAEISINLLEKIDPPTE